MKRVNGLLKGTLMSLSLVALAACSAEQPSEDEDAITISGKIASGFSKPVASKTGGDV